MKYDMMQNLLLIISVDERILVIFILFSLPVYFIFVL